MKSVDLGAAPGGWTWQLVNRSMMVTAVDNGPMQKELMDTAQVDHREEGAFTFQPSQSVDWMVCDIVDKPARSAELMARWLANGWCRETIFNLKLPMKQRWQAVQDALNRIEGICAEQGVPIQKFIFDISHVTGAVPYIITYACASGGKVCFVFHPRLWSVYSWVGHSGCVCFVAWSRYVAAAVLGMKKRRSVFGALPFFMQFLIVMTRRSWLRSH